MNLNDHPIVKTKVPLFIKEILRQTHLPGNEEELIQLSQELAKSIIKFIEPVKLN